MHELFEHTADLGLRVRADDLESLFAESGLCLLCAMVDNPDDVRADQVINVAIPSTSELEHMLIDWLRFLLQTAEEQRILYSKFVLEFSDSGLSGTAWGEPIDTSRHLLSREVKAITYHDVKVGREGSGWIAEVIVDI